MSESALYPAIIGALSHDETRLFRVQSGLFWSGRVIERSASRLVLLNPRAVKVGVPGMPDLIGWTSAGWREPAVFVAIEAKGPRTRTSTEQAAFIELVKRHGGRAGIARSVEDARQIIGSDPTY